MINIFGKNFQYIKKADRFLDTSWSLPESMEKTIILGFWDRVGSDKQLEYKHALKRYFILVNLRVV